LRQLNGNPLGGAIKHGADFRHAGHNSICAIITGANVFVRFVSKGATMPMGMPLLVHPLAATIRWFFGLSLIMVVLKVGADLLAFPGVVSAAGVPALIYLGLFAVALFLYAGFALVWVRDAAAQTITLQQGTVWGCVCGAAWIIELSVANLGWLVPHLGGLFGLLYTGSASLGFVLPGVAGLWAAWQARQLRAGIEAGLLCGMLASLVLFLTYSALSVLLLQVGQHDPQIVREFQRSGLTDLSTYIVGDYLAAMIAHLWMGLLTGVGFGALGSSLGLGFVNMVRDRAR